MPPRLPAPLARGLPKLHTANPHLQPFCTTQSTYGRHDRELLFEWLRGQGSQFKTHDGHSNYLTNMSRRRAAKRDEQSAEEKEAQVATEMTPEVKAMVESAKEQDGGSTERDRRGRDKPPPSSQPFPLNPAFKSQPVLSEEARELIWEKVRQRGESLKAVSAELGVDIRRVAAVFRLKEVEKNWIAQKKPLARPYSRAVMSMLPQTVYRPNSQPPAPHEPINEIHAHGLAMQQLFLPVAESRVFTRADAAAAFHRGLLSPDRRVPHPELVQRERDLLAGMSEADSQAKFEVAARTSEVAVAAERKRVAQEAAARTTAVEGRRCEFRFTSINVDDVGRIGRSRKGVGWRYGWPYPDRKTGQVKIPTKVE